MILEILQVLTELTQLGIHLLIIFLLLAFAAGVARVMNRSKP